MVSNWYAEHSEKRNEAMRKWRAKNPHKGPGYERARRMANPGMDRTRRANPEENAKINARHLQWQVKFPQKHNAHQSVNRAIKRGELQVKPCQVCGSKAQAHHEDYSKPLDVIWLCSKHHGEVHRKW